MDKVRFGVIGVGNQGSAYVKNTFGNNKVENGYITAICDNNPAKIEAVKAKNRPYSRQSRYSIVALQISAD